MRETEREKDRESQRSRDTERHRKMEKEMRGRERQRHTRNLKKRQRETEQPGERRTQGETEIDKVRGRERWKARWGEGQKERSKSTTFVELLLPEVTILFLHFQSPPRIFLCHLSSFLPHLPHALLLKPSEICLPNDNSSLKCHH